MLATQELCTVRCGDETACSESELVAILNDRQDGLTTNPDTYNLETYVRFSSSSIVFDCDNPNASDY